MCRGLNPDFSTWPEQSGQAVGREVGREERREGNPGNCFEPSPQSPHSLFCTKQQLSRPFWQQHLCLSSLPLLSAFLQGPTQPRVVHVSVWAPLHWASAVMTLGGDFRSQFMKRDIYDSPSPFAIRIFLSENLLWHCFFLLLFCFGSLFPFGNVPQAAFCQPC